MMGSLSFSAALGANAMQYSKSCGLGGGQRCCDGGGDYAIHELIEDAEVEDA